MERRHSLRAPVHGTAVLIADGGVIAGAIENLSLGGVLVRSRARVHGVDVELHLPAARVFATGTSVRRRDERVAIRFDDLSADAEDAIEDEIVRALGAARTRPVLIVDGVEERRLDIADALRDRAMTPLTPRTPLEVV